MCLQNYDNSVSFCDYCIIYISILPVASARNAFDLIGLYKFWGKVFNDRVVPNI